MAVQDYTTGGGANKVTYNAGTQSFSNDNVKLTAGTGLNNAPAPSFNSVSLDSLNNDQLNNVLKYTSLTPSQVNNPVSITADTLKGTSAPVIPPTPNPSTASTQLNATVSGYMIPPTGAVQNADGTYSVPVPTNTTDISTNAGIKNTLSNLYSKVTGKSAEQQALNEANQVDQKQQAYIDASNQYIQKKTAYQQEIDKIMSDPSITREQATQRAREIQRVQDADLANLAIEANKAQNNYQGALDIVDRKIKAEFDPIDQQIGYLEKMYALNLNDLTDSEKLKAQANIEALKTQANDLKDAKSKAYQLAVQHNAPASVLSGIDSATDIASTYKALGSYGATKSFLGGNNTLNGNELSDFSYTDYGKPLNATQAKSLGYGQRALQAGSIIDSIGGQFTGVTSVFGGNIPSILQTSDRQQYEQAKRNFVNAILRQESGAVISPSEFQSADKQYFPQAGDSKEVIAQKSINRNTTIKNLFTEAGVTKQFIGNQNIYNNKTENQTTNSSNDPLGIL